MGFRDFFKGETTTKGDDSEAPSPADPLAIDDAEERAAALKARHEELEAQRDAERARLQAEMGKSEERYRTGVAQATETATAHAEALDAAIAIEVSDRLGAAVTTYVADPTRTNATAVAAVWSDLDGRCRRTVGGALSPWHLTRAFVLAKSPDGERRLSDAPITNVHERVRDEAIQEFRFGRPIGISNALQAFEDDIDRRLAGPVGAEDASRHGGIL